jgi:hypothetical protein
MNGLQINAGQKFGRLTVLRELERTVSGGQILRQIELQCACGKITVTRPSVLSRGRTKSCGCLQREKASNSGKLRRKAPGEHAINSVVNTYVQAARKRQLDFALTREDVVRLIFSDCRYCGAEPQNVRGRIGMFGSIHYNGIDRVDNTKGYTPENSVACCEICNKAKRTMSAADFQAWIERAHSHLSQLPI